MVSASRSKRYAGKALAKRVGKRKRLIMNSSIKNGIATFSFEKDGNRGPTSLYKRILQVFAVPRRLVASQRALKSWVRTWPTTAEELELVLNFFQEDWSLYSASVRKDTGKFIRTTWFRWIGDKCYFIDIKYSDGIERFRWARKDHIDDIEWWCDNSDKATFAFVESVNAKLIEENAPIQPPPRPLPPRESSR